MNSYYMSLRTQYENLGDCLIARAAVEKLSSKGNLYLDIRGVPEAYLSHFYEYKRYFTKMGFLSLLLKGRSGSMVYVIKPGGYKLSSDWRFIFKRLAILLYFSMVRIFGGKIVKLPHSFESGGEKVAEFVERLIGLLVSENNCRDYETIAAYKKIGVVQASYSEDMAMHFSEGSSCFKVAPESVKESVVISLRYDRPSQVDLALKVANSLASRSSLNISVVSQVTFDNELNKKTLGRLGGASFVEYDLSAESVSEIVSQYSRAKYVVSNRLHSLLLGRVNGAIPIAVVDPVKDRKIIGCLNAIGDFVILSSPSDADRFICNKQQ